MLLVAHVRERPWTVGLKVNAVETEYDATVHGILGNLLDVLPSAEAGGFLPS